MVGLEGSTQKKELHDERDEGKELAISLIDLDSLSIGLAFSCPDEFDWAWAWAWVWAWA